MVRNVSPCLLVSLSPCLLVFPSPLHPFTRSFCILHFAFCIRHTPTPAAFAFATPLHPFTPSPLHLPAASAFCIRQRRCRELRLRRERPGVAHELEGAPERRVQLRLLDQHRPLGVAQRGGLRCAAPQRAVE